MNVKRYYLRKQHKHHIKPFNSIYFITHKENNSLISCTFIEMDSLKPWPGAHMGKVKKMQIKLPHLTKLITDAAWLYTFIENVIFMSSGESTSRGNSEVGSIKELCERDRGCEFPKLFKVVVIYTNLILTRHLYIKSPI